MAGKTNYLEARLIDHILRATASTAPTTVYAALFTAAPNDAYTSGVPTGTEVSGNAYARQAITFGATSGTPKQTANSALITFPTPTPSGWGTVTHFGIFDALTTGNLLYWAALTASKVINANDTVTFPISSMTVTED